MYDGLESDEEYIWSLLTEIYPLEQVKRFPLLEQQEDMP
jgi:hypothetical protein